MRWPAIGRYLLLAGVVAAIPVNALCEEHTLTLVGHIASCPNRAQLESALARSLPSATLTKAKEEAPEDAITVGVVDSDDHFVVTVGSEQREFREPARPKHTKSSLSKSPRPTTPN